MSTSFYRHKTIVITGASSGIGKALAFAMAQEGTHLVLAARRLEEIEKIKLQLIQQGAKCSIYFLDVANAASIETFANSLLTTFDTIDVLVNNAGISQRSQAEETPIDVDRKIMEVNFFGQVHLTKMLWPGLIKSAHANIVLISSVVGTFGFPQRSAYSASKHALEGFFESWLLENKRTNIHFTTVSPGRIKTNISVSALKADGSAHNTMDEGQQKGITAEACAQKIALGVAKGKRKIYVAKGEMVLIILRKYLPFLYFTLVKKLKLS